MQTPSRRFIIALIILIMSSGFFFFIANLISNESIKSFDAPIIAFIQGMEAPWLTILLKTFTWIGSAYVVVPVTLITCGYLYFVAQRRGQAFLFAILMVSTILSNELLKLYFNRERPEIYRIIDASGLSFPSGHTMMAFSLYTMLAYVLWQSITSLRQRFALILFTMMMISMIAVSRIYLGVHYPSDIVGGLAASLFLVTLLITVFEFIHSRLKNSPK